MKLKVIGAGAVCALALSACGGGADVKDAGDYSEVKLTKETSQEDSLGYMIGNMAAWQHVMMVQNDTTMKGEEAMKAYNEGYFAGLSLVQDGKDAYNKGLLAGINAGLDIQELNRLYGLKISPDAVASGYKADMNSQADEKKAADSQNGAMSVMRNLVATRSAAAKAEYAKKGKYQKDGNEYYRLVKQGNGAAAQGRSQVYVKMNMLDAKGQEVMPGAGDQINPMTVGNAPMPVMNKILSMMKDGDVYELLVTGEEVFGGGRTPQNVKPLEVYTFTIELVPDSEVPAPGTGETPDVTASPAAAGVTVDTTSGK